jgi:hypothetical protein
VGTLDLGNDVDQIGKVDDWDLGLMHHNVQSLNNKLLGIAMMLTVDNLNMNILCFTEHWLLEDHMNITNIDPFRPVSKFCRENCALGQSCIFTGNTIQAEEDIYLSCLGSEKPFQMSMTELSDLGNILACIYMYMSPDSDFDKFGSKLEILITKVHSQGKQLSVVI